MNAALPHVDTKLLNWFPVEDARPSKIDGKPQSDQPHPGDRYSCSHRMRWTKVVGPIQSRCLRWIAANCRSNVARYLTHTLFFEDRTEAVRFQREVR